MRARTTDQSSPASGSRSRPTRRRSSSATRASVSGSSPVSAATLSRRSCDAALEALRELHAVGDGELGDVEISAALGLSPLHAWNLRNTRAVDIGLTSPPYRQRGARNLCTLTGSESTPRLGRIRLMCLFDLTVGSSPPSLGALNRGCASSAARDRAGRRLRAGRRRDRWLTRPRGATRGR